MSSKLTQKATEIVEERKTTPNLHHIENKARIRVIIFSLCGALFLAALDVTIVATALPTIAAHFNATASEYAWIGSSYTLASTSSTLVWVKLSDIWGRKPIILLANALFLVGSLLAALSVSISMLIGSRITQGIGGGGLNIMVTVIIGDLFTLRDRAKYYGFIGIVWAVASGLGPVLGGVFAQTIGWRWCFFVNLPFDGISFVLIFFFLHIATPRITFRKAVNSFDWIGGLTIVGGTICFLYGLESGAGRTRSWDSAYTLCLLISGVILVAFFIFYEAKYARYPIVPVHIFSCTSNIGALGVGFCHSFVFIAYDYFLPLYFQVVLHATPILSGVYLFALIVPLSAVSAGTGFYLKRTGKYIYAIWFGLVMMTTGTALLMNLDFHLVWWKIILYQAIAGVGAGTVFQSPLIALQSRLRSNEIAAGSAAFTFIRSISTSVSIVAGSVVLQKELGSEILTNSASQDGDSNPVSGQRYTSALSKMWILYTAFCGLAILFSLMIAKTEIKDASYIIDIETVEEPVVEPCSDHGEKGDKATSMEICRG